MPSITDLTPLPLDQPQAKPMAQWLAEYQALKKQPLLITADLITPYIGAIGDRLHFDSILAYAWVASQPYPVAFNDAMVTPLPLELLRTVDGPSDAVLPVWAATCLLPQGDVLRDKAYWHKRYPVDRSEFSTKLNASMVGGRNKEYRVPMQTIHVPQLRSVVIGNHTEIDRLLKFVSNVGTRRTQGYGRVGRWSIEPLDWTLEEARSAIPNERPMPANKGFLAGFTPPYWYAPWHTTIAN